MSEEIEGVKEEQIADVPETTNLAETEVGQDQDVSEKTKYHFRALEAEKERVTQEAAYWRQQAQLQQNQKQVAEFDLNSKSDEDIPSYGELKKIRARDQQERGVLMQKISDLETKTAYSDFDYVVKTYLPDVLKEDPSLVRVLENSTEMNRLAYKLAQSSPRYHQEQLVKQNKNAVDRIVQNANRTQPATTRKNATVQDEDTKYKNMTDEDILKNFNMAKARY